MAQRGCPVARLDALDPVLDEEGRLAWAPLEQRRGRQSFLGLEGERLCSRLWSGLRAPGQRAWSIFRLLAPDERRDAAIWAGAQPQRMAYGPPLLRRLRRADRAVSRRLGPQMSSLRAEHFPRVDPVVIMLAEHEGRVLVGRQQQYPPGRYSALAGFVEPGESIEEAVARELIEEAGVAVTDVRYVASQPWPFPGSLMIACLAPRRIGCVDARSRRAGGRDSGSIATRSRGSGRRSRAPFQAPPPYAIANTLLTRWSARKREKPDEAVWGAAATAAFAGRLRGRAGDAACTCSVSMTGIQEVPGPGDPDGNGTVEVRVNPRTGEICWNLYARRSSRRPPPISIAARPASPGRRS